MENKKLSRKASQQKGKFKKSWFVDNVNCQLTKKEWPVAI